MIVSERYVTYLSSLAREEIPYLQVSESAVYINSTACQELGVTIPEAMLATATDMAE